MFWTMFGAFLLARLVEWVLVAFVQTMKRTNESAGE